MFMENRFLGLSMFFWFRKPSKCDILASFRTDKSSFRLLFLHPFSFHAVTLLKLFPINLPDFLRDELFDVVPICLDKHGRAFLVFRVFKISQSHSRPEHGIVGILLSIKTKYFLKSEVLQKEIHVNEILSRTSVLYGVGFHGGNVFWRSQSCPPTRWQSFR